MSAERSARKTIDALLAQAGWHVCDVTDADIHAARGVAVREFPLIAVSRARGGARADAPASAHINSLSATRARSDTATSAHARVMRSPRRM